MNPRVVVANLVVSFKSFNRAKPALFFMIAFPIILILVFGALFEFFIPGILAMAVMTAWSEEAA